MLSNLHHLSHLKGLFPFMNRGNVPIQAGFFCKAKGQLISKCFFLTEDSPKKRTKEFAFLVAI